MSVRPAPDRVRAIFDAAADLEAEARAGYVRDACAGDAVVEREVLALLSYVSAPTLDGATRLESAAAPETIGRFEVIGKLGEGGMGVVFHGRDRTLDRDVALKLVNHGGGDQGRVRLLREAQAMARIAHPNVVPVYEVGPHGDQVFVAMELVRGATLASWLRERPRPWRDVVRAIVDAGRGLAAAHRAGLLHRDVKPDNILIGDDGRARIADFGLARAELVADGGRGDGGGPATAALAVELTHDGAVVGSPGFMSPEHFIGTVTAFADQWSLAATAYYALFHAPPFVAGELAGLRDAVLTGTPAAPPRREVPPAVVDAILRGLERHPEDRFASVDAFVEALAAALAVDPASDRDRFRRQRRGLALGLGVLGVLGTLANGVRSGFSFDVPMRVHLVNGALGLASMVGAIVGFRRALWGTSHDRRVMSLILVAAATVVVHRVIAYHSPPLQVMRMDALITLALLVVGAINLERWLWASAALMTAYLLASLAIPSITAPAFNLALASTIALGVWFWRELR